MRSMYYWSRPTENAIAGLRRKYPEKTDKTVWLHDLFDRLGIGTTQLKVLWNSLREEQLQRATGHTDSTMEAVSSQVYTTLEDFLLEAYGRDYGFSRSFDNEDMSPAGQSRKKAQEEREALAARSRQLANPYQAAPKPRMHAAPPPQRPAGTNTVMSTAGNKGMVTFAFAELLGPLKKAMESLTTAQRTASKVGSANFKQGMDVYYRALNGPSCREIDKKQYHEDAKECRDLEDLYVLISMYIEEYFENTNTGDEGSAFTPKRRKAMESEDERQERTRQNWY